MSAYEKAKQLLDSGDPNALVKYIEEWRERRDKRGARYIIDVVSNYAEIGVQMHEPDRVIGKLRLRLSDQRVEWAGVDVDFTLTEFKVVKLLTDHIGTYVSYRAIYDAIHYVGFVAGEGKDGYRTNVRSCIKRIRRKFMAADPSWNGITNYTCMGYRWTRPDDAGVPLQMGPNRNLVVNGSKYGSKLGTDLLPVDHPKLQWMLEPSLGSKLTTLTIAPEGSGGFPNTPSRDNGHAK